MAVRRGTRTRGNHLARICSIAVDTSASDRFFAGMFERPFFDTCVVALVTVSVD